MSADSAATFSVQGQPAAWQSDLALARERLHGQRLTLVTVRGGQVMVGLDRQAKAL